MVTTSEAAAGMENFSFPPTNRSWPSSTARSFTPSTPSMAMPAHSSMDILPATVLLIALALSGALITGLLVFWKNIVGWIKKAVNKIKEVLGLTPDGTRTFITQAVDGFRNKSKYYYSADKRGVVVGDKVCGEQDQIVIVVD